MDIDALMADLDMPDISAGIEHWQREAGASFASGVATTFGNDGQALEALSSGAVLYDVSRASRLRVGGEGHERKA